MHVQLHSSNSRGPHQPLIVQHRLGAGLLQLALLGRADAVFFQLLCTLPLALCQRLYLPSSLLCTVCQGYQATVFLRNPKAITSLRVRLIMTNLNNACLGCLRHLLAEPSHQKRMHGSRDTRSGPCSWLQEGLAEACRARRKVCTSEFVIAGQRMECFMAYCQQQ